MSAPFDQYVMQAEHLVPVQQLLAALEERQFDQERAADDLAAGLLDQLAAGLHRAAGRQHVIDQQHAAARA